MDIPATAQMMTNALAPFMALLFRVGEQAAEETGNRIGAAGWESAKRLWAQVWRRAEHDPTLVRAARDVASVPADPAALRALQAELQRLLSADPGLRESIAELVTKQARPVQQANVARDPNIGVQAGSITNSTVTGIGRQERPRR